MTLHIPQTETNQAEMAERKIRDTRKYFIMNNPFYASIAMQLNLKPKTDMPWAIAVDGEHLFFNPSRTLEYTENALRGAIAECVMHCANMHPWRGIGFETKKWNAAADYSIHHVLAEHGFEIPAESKTQMYGNRSAEEIYSLLVEEEHEKPDEQPDGQNDSDSGDGSGKNPQTNQQQNQPGAGVIQHNEATNQTINNAQRDMMSAVQNAIKIAKAQGSMPAGLETLITDLTTTHTDWRTALRLYMTDIAKNDYTFAKPNPRTISLGLYLPALRSTDEMGEIIIALDTSGSVIDLAQEFVNETAQILEDVKPSRVTIIQCDAEVSDVQTFEHGETPNIKHVYGGGGTDFVPVFDFIAEKNIEPTLLIFMTDLAGDYPAVAPDYPVLWAVTDMEMLKHYNPPFGETIEIPNAKGA